MNPEDYKNIKQMLKNKQAQNKGDRSPTDIENVVFNQTNISI
jgi:hypothetical protein